MSTPYSELLQTAQNITNKVNDTEEEITKKLAELQRIKDLQLAKETSYKLKRKLQND